MAILANGKRESEKARKRERLFQCANANEGRKEELKRTVEV